MAKKDDTIHDGDIRPALPTYGVIVGVADIGLGRRAVSVTFRGPGGRLSETYLVPTADAGPLADMLISAAAGARDGHATERN